VIRLHMWTINRVVLLGTFAILTLVPQFALAADPYALIVGHGFRKGHALRLEVSSSNFPRFDKNLNTGDDAAVRERSVPATNTIYHDSEHPSALVLPIVPTT